MSEPAAREEAAAAAAGQLRFVRVARSFLLGRARQCMAQRGRISNLILTDFYHRGDLIGAVRALNGLDGQRAAGTIPLNPVG